MKINQGLGIMLWVFAVVTLLNLFDTMQTIEQLSRYVDTSMKATQIFTWVGIAFTQFVLGLVLMISDEGIEPKDGMDSYMAKWRERETPRPRPKEQQYSKKQYPKWQYYLSYATLAFCLTVLLFWFMEVLKALPS